MINYGLMVNFGIHQLRDLSPTTLPVRRRDLGSRKDEDPTCKGTVARS